MRTWRHGEKLYWGCIWFDQWYLASKSTWALQRLGLALALSTEGRDASGSKTTSIMVIDGSPVSTNGNKPTDYLELLRNIDMLLRGYGSMVLRMVMCCATDLLMVMLQNLQLVIYQVPNIKSYRKHTSPLDNFKLTNDVLLGIKIKLLGDIGFSLIPIMQPQFLVKTHYCW